MRSILGDSNLMFIFSYNQKSYYRMQKSADLLQGTRRRRASPTTARNRHAIRGTG